jgi:outer membrane biosynthesis protein TonB
LQPHGVFRHYPLACALGLSVALHLLLLWPASPVRPEPPSGGARLAARLRPAPSVDSAVSVEPSPVIARDTRPIAPHANLPREVPDVDAMPTPPPAVPAPDEAGLRALRYALLRELDVAGAAQGPAFTMAIELRVAARRIDDVRVLRGSGDPRVDARMVAAFSAAAAQVRLPAALPDSGFALLIELEGEGSPAP